MQYISKAKQFHCYLMSVVFALCIMGVNAASAQVPQCGSHAPIGGQTFSWFKDPFGIRSFMNSKAAQFGHATLLEDSAFKFDTTTAQYICYVAGYTRVAHMDCVSVYDGGRCGYYSPSDKRMAMWDAVRKFFTFWNAKEVGNIWISSLTCADPLPPCTPPVCTAGQQESTGCTSGYAGVCSAGWKNRTCQSNGQWGPYSTCNAEVLPGTRQEICTDGLDNDCDGATDSQDTDCPVTVCTAGQQETINCTSAFPGVCSGGSKTRVCQSNGQWGVFGTCNPNVQPGSQVEICNDGIDNDCDGAIDSQDQNCNTQVCTPGQSDMLACSSGYAGVCSAGWKTRICQSNGQWGQFGTCQPEIFPGTRQEICTDGLDNDCDGAIDSQDSNCTSGVCLPGQQEAIFCNSGLPGVCSSGNKIRVCQSNSQWGAFGPCNSIIFPGQQVEVCNDGLDNDCDGAVDQQDQICPAGVCFPGQHETIACGTGYAGACAGGIRTRVCQHNNQWSVYGNCIAGLLPGTAAEICPDGIDNDCDGLTDEQGCSGCSQGVDRCGVCGGNNASCPSCETKDISDLLILLDNGTLDLLNIVRQATAKLKKVKGSLSGANQSRLAKAQSLHQQAWQKINELPKKFVVCANSSVCASFSHAATISAYQNASSELETIARAIDRQIATALRKKTNSLRVKTGGYARKAARRNAQNQTEALNVPTTESRCT